MWLFKKVDATILDVGIAYGCGAFLMCIVGSVAYGMGKRNGIRTVVTEFYENYNARKIINLKGEL